MTDKILIDEWTLIFRRQVGDWSNYKLCRERKGKKKWGVLNSYFLSHNGQRFAMGNESKKAKNTTPGNCCCTFCRRRPLGPWGKC